MANSQWEYLGGKLFQLFVDSVPRENKSNQSLFYCINKKYFNEFESLYRD